MFLETAGYCPKGPSSPALILTFLWYWGGLESMGTELQPWSLPREFRREHCRMAETGWLVLWIQSPVARCRVCGRLSWWAEFDIPSPVLLSGNGLYRELFPELGNYWVLFEAVIAELHFLMHTLALDLFSLHACWMRQSCWDKG